MKKQYIEEEAYVPRYNPNLAPQRSIDTYKRVGKRAAIVKVLEYDFNGRADTYLQRFSWENETRRRGKGWKRETAH